MNVNELRQLSDWYIEHFSKINPLYNGLLSPIQHNSSQPNKQPIESQLESLMTYLSAMKFDDLSLQQLHLLASIGVDKYIGTDGASFVSSVVRSSNYDPATATNEISQAIGKLNDAHSGFKAYLAALKSLGIDQRVDDTEKGAITIRIGFQNDASINNVTDWKEYAREWYDIIRGIALAYGEAPEATKVVGASTGSIILILAGTLAVTKLLALISKSIASVAKDVVEIGNEIENLRHKKLLNGVIETNLKKQQQDKKEKALKDIIAIIKKEIPKLDGEKVTALEVSINKLLSFNEKGGNVDFVAPEADLDDSDAEQPNSEVLAALGAVRTAIHEYQSVREQLKLLTDNTAESKLEKAKEDTSL